MALPTISGHTMVPPLLLRQNNPGTIALLEYKQARSFDKHRRGALFVNFYNYIFYAQGRICKYRGKSQCGKVNADESTRR